MQLSPSELLQELEVCSDIRGACFSSKIPVYVACNINIEKITGETQSLHVTTSKPLLAVQMLYPDLALPNASFKSRSVFIPIENTVSGIHYPQEFCLSMQE